MTVGGLTRHLVGQSQYAVSLLATGPSATEDAPLHDLVAHYAEAAWIRDDLDAGSNRFVREKSDVQAAEGPGAAVALQAAALAALPTVLADSPATVVTPWQASRLAVDDFLLTRLIEIVVHCDDLADSVSVPTPGFGDAVLRPVLGLLTALAVERHGQDALVRTLTRPQRAPRSVAAF